MDDRKLTDLELERWLAGELPEPRQRVAGEADRARLEALRAEHAAWLATVDVAAELRAIEQRVARSAPARRRSTPARWAASAGIVAAAAAVVLLVVARRPGADGGDDDLRSKGDSIALIMYAAGAEGTAGGRRLATGDTVRPGDRVRFEVRVPDRGYVAIVGIDSPGNATIYYPFGGRAPAAIDPRSGGVLPGAIALDATPGNERFFAVYAARPFALDPALFAGLRTGAAPHGVAIAGVTLGKIVTP
jgi:hypothetical protein